MSNNKKSTPRPINTDALSDQRFHDGWMGESSSGPIGESYSRKGTGPQIMNSFAPPTRPDKGGNNGTGNSGK